MYDLINLDDLKGHSALSLLENYEGINPYILKLKNELLKRLIKILFHFFLIFILY